ncbi:hypothetical protein POTOM_035087 [Populus tomentosa]|uniref:Protein kinase domain-containing protein n=1 Tax=Populus tomentosa TaxID=118781 RepID=A0A8X7Z021_POPTO|nr:hypothetical protein POTOM_035087 [Populus tomentosa]
MPVSIYDSSIIVKSSSSSSSSTMRLTDFSGTPYWMAPEHSKDFKNNKFSKEFKDMVASCLNQDPSKRPSADQLLEYSFFKNCERVGFLFKKVFNGLPNVKERFEEAKALNDGTSSLITAGTDTDSAGPRMKTRRISGWKFN